MDEYIFHRTISLLEKKLTYWPSAEDENNFSMLQYAAEKVYNRGWENISPECETNSGTIKFIMSDAKKFELVKEELIKERLKNG